MYDRLYINCISIKFDIIILSKELHIAKLVLVCYKPMHTHF